MCDDPSTNIWGPHSSEVRGHRVYSPAHSCVKYSCLKTIKKIQYIKNLGGEMSLAQWAEQAPFM